MDADELDRYMSGQPAREPRFDPYGRTQSTGRTERTQPRQPQPAQPQYDEYEDDFPQPEAPSPSIDDEYGYEGDFGYEDYPPEPEPAPVRQRQPRQSARTRQREPEYDDDLYDDPYVLDDEEAPRRQQRRPQRSSGSRVRQAQPSASFTLPPVIAEAPLVKDRIALAMLGVAVVSILAMLIIVTTGRDGLEAMIFTHVNANGEPENLQSASAIWNLPLIAGMVTLISGIAAWFLARWDAFLPRFLLGGSIGVQFVVWVAVIAYIF